MQPETKSGFNLRALTSLVVMFSFLTVAVTGLVLYLRPPGIMSPVWGDVHTVLSFVLIAGAAFHVSYNWKPLVGYLKSRASRGMRARCELALAFAIVGLLTVGTAYNLPVLKTIASAGRAEGHGHGPHGPNAPQSERAAEQPGAEPHDED